MAEQKLRKGLVYEFGLVAHAKVFCESSHFLAIKSRITGGDIHPAEREHSEMLKRETKPLSCRFWIRT